MEVGIWRKEVKNWEEEGKDKRKGNWKEGLKMKEKMEEG